MAFDEPEDTKLIDVSELQPQMAEDFAQEETAQDTVLAATEESSVGAAANAHSDDAPIITPTVDAGPTRLASLSERFTAWCIDTTLLWYAYWGAVQLYRHVADGSWNGPAPTNLDMSGLAFHGAFLLVALLYYFFGEGIFSTTVGKFFCWMSVRRSDGRIASLTAIVLRTIFRPIDYLLGPITLAIIEFTAQNQRLGDLLANTVVIKRQRSHTAATVEWEHLASSTGRLATGLVNGLLLAVLTVGGVMILSPSLPFISQWIVLAGPGLLCLGVALLQVLTHTTPAGWCGGYCIVQENGAPIGFSHAFLRTLFIPIDLLCAPLAVVLSPRRQRVGDMIAGTLVVRAPRSARGALSLVGMFIAVAAVGYAASLNPAPWLNRNFKPAAPATWINPDFQLNFIPRTELFPDFPATQPSLTPFRIAAFRFAEGTPNNARSPAVYIPGETAFFVFDIEGFRTKGNSVWVQQDLAIRYPDNTFGLRQENIIDHKQIKRVPGPLVLKNSINLPQGLPVGKYTVFITVRDQLGGGAPVVREDVFYIKELATERVEPTTPAPTSPGALPAPDATPPAQPPVNSTGTPGSLPAAE